MPIKTQGHNLDRLKQLSVQQIEAELQKAVEETAEYGQKLFDESAGNFKDKPRFIIKKEGPWKVRVYTENENYNRLNGGTRAHLIAPRPGGVLRFPAAFGPKTRPGALHPMAGYRSGEFVFTRLPVLHPGTKPRKFDEMVAEELRPYLLEKVREALKRGFNI